MSRYRAGTPDILAYLLSIESIKIQSLQPDPRGVTDVALRNMSWYLRSLIYGRLIFHKDYEALSCEWSAASAKSHRHNHSLETSFRVQIS